jgi:predicted nucleic acid-binding protein
VGAAWVVLDDLPARRLATGLGLPVIGTVGLLPMAKRFALLPEVRPSLEALIAVDFYVSPELFAFTLALAGEGN